MAKKETKGSNDEPKAEDKALETKDNSLTKEQMIKALDSVGVKVNSKSKKDEIEKIYKENEQAIKMFERLQELKDKCIVKSFGSFGESSLCKKCLKKQPDVYKDCEFYQGISAKKKVAAKGTRKMGHRTGTDLWGTRKGKYNNHFCKAVLSAGENGITMADAKKASWNPKGHAFNETLDRLVKEGIAERGKEGRIYVTKKGIELSGTTKEQKAA